MELLNPDFLKRLEKVKVGELRAALDGMDPMVRVVDVPAVQTLLGPEPREPEPDHLEACQEIAKMANLLWSLSRKFSDTPDGRDLQIAHILSDKASTNMGVVRILNERFEYAIDIQEGSREELIDMGIAHASACHLFGIAFDLEALSKALLAEEGDALALWKRANEAKQNSAESVLSNKASTLALGPGDRPGMTKVRSLKRV